MHRADKAKGLIYMQINILRRQRMVELGIGLCSLFLIKVYGVSVCICNMKEKHWLRCCSPSPRPFLFILSLEVWAITCQSLLQNLTCLHC